MSNERKHERFSPSRAEQMHLCPGAPNLLARTQARPTTTYAAEGHRAHAVLEAGLLNACLTADKAIENSDHCMEDFDTDFKNAINEALDYVWNLLDSLAHFGDAQLFVEVRVNPPVYAAPGEAAGYCDIAIYSANARRLWVIDYKHGIGIVKEVIENKQALQYGAGFLYEENGKIDAASVDHVTLVIVQPRAFHPEGPIREWDTTPMRLSDYLIELDDAITASLDPNAPLVPGETQCRFCDAKAVCPAVEAKAVAALSHTFRTVRDVTEPNLPSVKAMDAGRLAYIKQAAPFIRSFLDEVDQRVYESMAIHGHHIPGFKCVLPHPKREWFGEEQERAEKLAALIGCPVTDLYRATFRTITDLEKEVKDAFKKSVGRGRKKQAAEQAAQLFAYFTTKQSSGSMTIVPEDDPRPAANKAASSFNQLAGHLPPTHS